MRISLLDTLHDAFVLGRRARRLTELLCPLIPENGQVLDVGSGDGKIANAISRRRPDINIRGIDVLVRPDASIPVEHFDGSNIPYPSRSHDCVMFMDVLHHCQHPSQLLREAARVSRRYSVLKDHTQNGFLAYATLRFMDDVGNARFSVALPHNYWSRERWFGEWKALGLNVESFDDDLRLYPRPADLLFGRKLHFIARLVAN